MTSGFHRFLQIEYSRLRNDKSIINYGTLGLWCVVVKVVVSVSMGMLLGHRVWRGNLCFLSVGFELLSCRDCKCVAVLLSVGVKLLSCRDYKCEAVLLSVGVKLLSCGDYKCEAVLLSVGVKLLSCGDYKRDVRCVCINVKICYPVCKCEFFVLRLYKCEWIHSVGSHT